MAGTLRRMSHVAERRLSNTTGLAPSSMERLLGWKPKSVLNEMEEMNKKNAIKPVIARQSLICC